MRKKDRKKALVLGVGNILLRDEGLGVRVVEHLNRRFTFPPGVECVDGGTLGLGLTSLMEGFNRIIIVDALSGVDPGAPRRIAAVEIGRGLSPVSAVHGVGVKELLAIARFEGHAPEVVIIGAAPIDTASGIGLTPATEKKIPELARMVIKELEGLGIKAANRAGEGAQGARAVYRKEPAGDSGKGAQKKRGSPA
ncbi:MAG: HyaD/HybD family hydrogenase maturation endopeptidase [Deltaproteobacteria bacterium]|nr:HyaD/HybD family hydrogenase maturation endopeptidase [Deltaproteobacteria bacterium]